MKTYVVKECFYSLQGEGVRAGSPNVFLRFAGCNLDCARPTQAFDCDTDFVGGDRLTAAEIVALVAQTARQRCRWIVLTGGEPALQLDQALVDALLGAGFELAIETNGTRPLPAGLSWVCVSPKTDPETICVRRAHEVKYVLRAGDPLPATPVEADHYLLSPAFEVASKTDPAAPCMLPEENLRWCIQLCLEHPPWRLSVQQHKLWRVR